MEDCSIFFACVFASSTTGTTTTGTGIVELSTQNYDTNLLLVPSAIANLFRSNNLSFPCF